MSGQNCITFLNLSGDITITWDEQNRNKIIEMVRQKMEEGFTFFTVKRVPLLDIERKAKVTKRNVNKIESLIISDEEFDKLVAGIDDRDVATSLRQGSAKAVKRKARSDAIDTVKRLNKAEDVVKEQSVALRPIAGG